MKKIVIFILGIIMSYTASSQFNTIFNSNTPHERAYEIEVADCNGSQGIYAGLRLSVNGNPNTDQLVFSTFDKVTGMVNPIASVYPNNAIPLTHFNIFGNVEMEVITNLNGVCTGYMVVISVQDAPGGEFNPHLIELDVGGNFVSATVLYENNSASEHFNEIIQDVGGEFVMVGWIDDPSGYDLFVARFNPNTLSLNDKRYPFDINGDGSPDASFANDIIEAPATNTSADLALVGRVGNFSLLMLIETSLNYVDHQMFDLDNNTNTWDEAVGLEMVNSNFVLTGQWTEPDGFGNTLTYTYAFAVNSIDGFIPLFTWVWGNYYKIPDSGNYPTDLEYTANESIVISGFTNVDEQSPGSFRGDAFLMELDGGVPVGAYNHSYAGYYGGFFDLERNANELFAGSMAWADPVNVFPEMQVVGTNLNGVGLQDCFEELQIETIAIQYSTYHAPPQVFGILSPIASPPYTTFLVDVGQESCENCPEEPDYAYFDITKEIQVDTTLDLMDFPTDIIQDSDGNYVSVGVARKDAAATAYLPYIIKLDPYGNTIAGPVNFEIPGVVFNLSSSRTFLKLQPAYESGSFVGYSVVTNMGGTGNHFINVTGFFPDLSKSCSYSISNSGADWIFNDFIQNEDDLYIVGKETMAGIPQMLVLKAPVPFGQTCTIVGISPTYQVRTFPGLEEARVICEFSGTTTMGVAGEDDDNVFFVNLKTNLDLEDWGAPFNQNTLRFDANNASLTESVYAIDQRLDGRVIIAGNIDGSASNFILEFDRDQTFISLNTKIVNINSLGINELLTDMRVKPDGNIVIHSTKYYSGDRSSTISVLDPAYNELSYVEYNDPDFDKFGSAAIDICSDNGIIVAHSATSFCAGECLNSKFTKTGPLGYFVDCVCYSPSTSIIQVVNQTNYKSAEPASGIIFQISGIPDMVCGSFQCSLDACAQMPPLVCDISTSIQFNPADTCCVVTLDLNNNMNGAYQIQVDLVNPTTLLWNWVQPGSGFMLAGQSSNSLTLKTATGTQLPLGNSPGYLDFCLDDTVSTSILQNIKISYLDVTGQVIPDCMDSLQAECMLSMPIDTTITGCCDSLLIYGNIEDNRPTRIKQYNGNTYITSYRRTGNDYFGVFTKFNALGNLVWEVELDIESQFFDFVQTNNNEFLLVGRTMPVQNGGWQDNRSILAKVDDFGVQQFVNVYNNTGRETFFEIIKHPSPITPLFPYYILGIDNNNFSTSATAKDRLHLYNINETGGINFQEEYSFFNFNGQATDDDEVVDMISLSNGNVLLLGNINDDGGAGTFGGAILEVSGLTGAAVNPYESSIDMRFKDAVELPNGNLAVVGGYRVGGAGGSFKGGVFLFDNTLNLLQSFRFDGANELKLIREIEYHPGTEEIFVLTQGLNDLPIIFKYTLNASYTQMTEVASKYFLDGETAFSSPTIFTNATVNRLYYADARRDNPKSYGDFDVIFGSFHLDLIDSCLVDTTILSVASPFSTVMPMMMSVDQPLPAPTTANFTIPANMWEFICPDSTAADTCCLDVNDFEMRAQMTSIQYDISTNSATVSNPSLNDCNFVDIDWGDGNFTGNLPASGLPAMHNYSGSGPFTIDVLVTEVDQFGDPCFEYLISASTLESDCCDSLLIYGNLDDNRPTRIKQYNGNAYLTSYRNVGGDYYGVFSKFNGTGNLVWEVELDIESQFLDFVRTDNNEFLLVGRTMPLQNGGWQDNRSILAKVDDFGAQQFVNVYNNTGRETFFEIIRHPFPQNTLFPYYIVGIDNNNNSDPSALDRVHLYSLNDQGVFNIEEEYAFININGQVTDDDEVVDFIPLMNGNLLLLGNINNNTPPLSYGGLILELDGATGAVVNSYESTNNMRFKDAVELPNGNLAMVGGYRIGGAGGSFEGGVFLFDNTLNLLQSFRFAGTNELQMIREIEYHSTIEEIFVLAQGLNDLPIIFKYSVTPPAYSTMTQEASKYYLDGETAFSSPMIFTDASVNRLFYADARRDSPLSYGNFDVIFGSFNLNLTDSCLVDTSVLSIASPFTGMSPVVTSINNPLPGPTMANFSFPTNMWEFICPDSVAMDTCCIDVNDFEMRAQMTTIQYDISTNTITVSNPFLNDCNFLNINWGDGNFVTNVPATSLPVQYQYAVSGTYSIVIEVFEVDQAGNLCFEHVIMETVTPTSNLILEKGIIFSPNPFSDDFNITIESVDHQGFEIKVFSLDGKVILNDEVLPGQISKLIDLGSSYAGVYLVQLTGEDGNRAVYKMVKM